MRKIGLFLVALTVLLVGTPAILRAQATDSVKIHVSCQPAAPADTFYTVTCHNVVSDSALGNVGTFNVPMGQLGVFAYSRSVPPLTRVTVTVNAFGVNRSGTLSTNSTVATASAVSADGPPVSPAGFTITVCIQKAGGPPCP